jgi:glutamine synthetase
MDPPQTKKQGHKSAKDKKEGANRIGSAKHVRLAEQLAEKRKEWDEYKMQVHQWEIDQYMETF